MTPEPRVLADSDGPLWKGYDVALLDLDGVVYLQEQAVVGAAEALAEARRAGLRLEFVTNNASRRATEVAALLRSVGVPADPAEVVTSAQAAAALLADRLAPAANVLVVGAEALVAEVTDVGLTAVDSADARPVAVVQGYGPRVGWPQLAEAALAVQAGALWVATNADLTLPSQRGPLPGNGALVAAVTAATGRTPDEIVGKPHPRLHTESVRRSGAIRPLVVGDRLGTDIEGAIHAGTDSMLVLSGVTRPVDLLGAPPHRRPTYVAARLDGLLAAHPGVPVAAETTCGPWTARRSGTEIVLSGAGEAEQRLDALRALCGAAWSGSTPPERTRAEGAAAEVVLAELGLAR
ncbi:MAG TPA: HAD-IIA family hydrolase [Mycobacteriales bacterium]